MGVWAPGSEGSRPREDLSSLGEREQCCRQSPETEPRNPRRCVPESFAPFLPQGPRPAPCSLWAQSELGE